MNLLPELSERAISAIAAQLATIRRPKNVIVASIHWGPNWGYEVGERERRFAHALIERAGITIVHAYSCHHAKGLEVHDDRLIIYGCGDFLNDYEGIEGYEEFRGDLALMYIVSVDHAKGELVETEIIPLQIRQFRLARPSSQDVGWLQRTLDRESRKFATRVAMKPDGHLQVVPSA